jgi:hypothetical protein
LLTDGRNGSAIPTPYPCDPYVGESDAFGQALLIGTGFALAGPGGATDFGASADFIDGGVAAGEAAEDGAPSFGSTGRIAAESLKEKLAMEQVMSDPAAGLRLPTPMTDPRWPASDGWVKMAQNVNGVEVHYVRNTKTGAVDDFKFK